MRGIILRAKRQNAPAAAGEPDRYFTIFVPLFQRKTEADFLYWTQSTGGEFPWRKKFTTSNKAFFRATGEAVRTACRQLLEAGMPPQKIVRFGLLPCMDTLGQQLSRREKFIPQIMMSARAVQDGIDLLSPLIVGPDVLSLSETVVLGTVSGDIHTIGKTLVSIMLRSAGFHVVDLGTNVPPEKFGRRGRGRTTPTSSRSRQCSPRRSPA